MWQTAADGRYDIQNSIEEIDCRGIFRTDEKGNYLMRTVRPLGYYIPLDGPVGQMVMAQKRHGKRPAHIHFLISAPGYRELVTALYIAGDEHLEDDVVFGASGDLVAEVKANDPALADQGRAQHPLRFQPRARERGRQARRPRRRRPGAGHRGQRQGDRRPTAPRPRRCSPPPSSRRRAASWAACSAASELIVASSSAFSPGEKVPEGRMGAFPAKERPRPVRRILTAAPSCMHQQYARRKRR